MTLALPTTPRAKSRPPPASTLDRCRTKASVLAYGPGLGRSAELTDLIAWLYQTLDKPAVVDADALNALAERQDVLCRPGGPRILTPHPGEFARLAQIDHSSADDQRQATGHGDWPPDRRRRASQGTSHRDYRWRPTGDQHDGQPGHGERRQWRRADRRDHGAGVPASFAVRRRAARGPRSRPGGRSGGRGDRTGRLDRQRPGAYLPQALATCLA